MKQNDTKYHLLYIGLRDTSEYFPKEDREEYLKLIKELYNTHLNRESDYDGSGKYGIRYSTVHDDSRWSDTYEQFFRSKKKRDDVYEDWIKDRYWDSVMEQELEYPTPTPNVHNIKKIFKEGGKIYEEQTEK